jgi:hypothetical protein
MIYSSKSRRYRLRGWNKVRPGQPFGFVIVNFRGLRPYFDQGKAAAEEQDRSSDASVDCDFRSV